MPRFNRTSRQCSLADASLNLKPGGVDLLATSTSTSIALSLISFGLSHIFITISIYIYYDPRMSLTTCNNGSGSVDRSRYCNTYIRHTLYP